MAKLNPGEPAPDFELENQEGRKIKLSDFRGRKVLLYFYPKADTPGCTKQACAIRDARAELAGLGVASLGISPDRPAAQQKFDNKYGLGFPLLSDPDHAVASAYGAWGEKSRYGRTVKGIIRSSFLIDENGRIIRAWYQVKPEETVPKALEALKAG